MRHGSDRAQVPSKRAATPAPVEGHRSDASLPAVGNGVRRTAELHRGDALGPSGASTAPKTAEPHRHVDAAVAALAAAQRGVVSRAQLSAVGLGRGAIARRVSAGRLHRLHRGVYAVGHVALPPLAQDTAAVLACGPNAVLSHRSAAMLWGLIPRAPGPVDVTVPGHDCRSRPGIRAHASGALRDQDLARRDGLRVTAPPRTLVDIAGCVETTILERALNEALVQRLVSQDAVGDAVRQAGRRPGVAGLRDILDRLDGPRLTRSEAEDRLLALLRSAHLPLPRTNTRIGPYEIDALWQQQRLVVEVDGYAFHSGRGAFERDRVRDADLQARGLRVVRVTWRQLVDEPEAVVARIACLLGPAVQ
jgi:very-short-patch-repair endonuclease